MQINSCKHAEIHANMLKKYTERADQDGAPQQNSDNNEIISCDVCAEIIGGKKI